MDNLQLQSQLVRELTALDYPDSNRIAKEIITHLETTPELSTAEIITRLQTDEPWEHIRGWAEFYGRKFKVTSDTLIPRIETEGLVDLALEELKQNSGIKIVIDVGTGSGIIASTIALGTSEKIKIYATDISTEALEIANENIKSLGVKEQVKTVHTNLIDTLLTELSPTQEILIIANLPYIPTAEYEKLDSSVKDWEPKIALEAGNDGTDFYKELLESTQQLNATYLFEITRSNIAALNDLAEEKNLSIEIINDVFNKVRYVKLFH